MSSNMADVLSRYYPKKLKIKSCIFLRFLVFLKNKSIAFAGIRGSFLVMQQHDRRGYFVATSLYSEPHILIIIFFQGTSAAP